MKEETSETYIVHLLDDLEKLFQLKQKIGEEYLALYEVDSEGSPFLNGDMIKSTMEMRAKKSKYNHKDILDNDIMNLEDTTPQYMLNISKIILLRGLRSMIVKLQ